MILRVVSYPSKEDGGWIAVIPELPGCSAFGETAAEAAEEVMVAKELWIEAAKKEKRPVPKPISFQDLSGKFVLRLPKSLHGILTREALDEGVSLNTHILHILAAFAARIPGFSSRKGR